MAVRPSSDCTPALAQCPHCDGYDLSVPPAARGDDVVRCRVCSRAFTYAAVEHHALASARRRLAKRFLLPGSA